MQEKELTCKYGVKVRYNVVSDVHTCFLLVAIGAVQQRRRTIQYESCVRRL